MVRRHPIYHKSRRFQTHSAATGRTDKIRNAKDLMMQIARDFKDTSRKDIKKWRNAIDIARDPENPRRTELQDLYDDLITDGHLFSQMQLRLDSVRNTPFQIINRATGKVDDEKTRLFIKPWFFNFIKAAHDSIFKGHTLIEFQEFSGDHIKFSVIPRRNIIPDFKQIQPDLSRETKISYDDPYFDSWLIEIGEVNDLGLLNIIVPNLIWKRNIMQSWAEFQEKFGLPLVTATTNERDSKKQDAMLDMLISLGEQAVGVFPEGTTIDFKESNRADAYKVFDFGIERQNGEVSKAVIGGTMISDDGSSRSQSEVHADNLNKKIAVSDRRMISFLVNHSLMPILQSHGYSINPDQDEFVFKVTQDIDLKQYWEITQGMIQEGYEIEQDWISKTFDIPIIGKTEKPQPSFNAAFRGAKGSANEADSLEGYTYPAGVKLPEYSEKCEICGGYKTPDFSAALSSSEIDKLTDEMIRKIWEAADTVGTKSKLIAREGVQFLKGLRSGWAKRLNDVTWDSPDLLTLSYMEYNSFLFSSGKTEARLASISKLMIDKDKLQIRDFNDFKNRAQETVKNFNGSWLKTEYNLAVATAQNAAAYSRALQEAGIIDKFVYITAGDNNVREGHALLNGKVFSLKDKAALKVWPPNGYGCRCEAQQYPSDTDEVTKGSEAEATLGEAWKNSNFSVNRAELGQVFTKDQQYVKQKGVPDLKTMTFDRLGLDAASKRMSGKKALKLDNTITKNNVKDFYKSEEGHKLMGFEDYLGRKLAVRENKFAKLTAKQPEGFPHVADTLKQADEVWLSEVTKDRFTSTYLKFYKDQAIKVNAKVGKTSLEITDYEIISADEADKIRKGLLINI